MAIIQPLFKKNCPSTPPRKQRCDKKHRFTFRVDQDVWNKIMQLSLFAGGIGHNASLNSILNLLVESALRDEEIMERIQREFPQAENYIVIRNW
jgi:hypothetical protein